MLLTIGVLGIMSARAAHRARLALAMNLTYSVGVMAAGGMNVWLGRPAPLGYMIAFVLIGLLSAVTLITLPALWVTAPRR
jgi:hypothetical protein